ncbi:unnamed protein product [Rhizopus stolonifer]
MPTPVLVNPGRRSGLVQQEQQQQQQPETLFERVPSETPFSTGGLDELDPESIKAPRVAWREPIIWAFLQIMLGIHDELAEATDNLYKERIWANAKGLFVEELTEYVERSTEFCANVSVYKMQRKWDSMKRKYKDMYNAANLQTGVGGRDPADIWKYYDEMGQILKNDSSIQADVSIETQRNDVDEEDEEIQAARRARARNVNRITSATIEQRVINPSKRYAQAFINMERERHTAENHIGTNDDLAVQGTRTTGAGRNTQELLEQMYEIKQGHRPNLFATNSQHTFSSSSPFSLTRDADSSTSTNNYLSSSTSLLTNNTNTNIQ